MIIQSHFISCSKTLLTCYRNNCSFAFFQKLRLKLNIDYFFPKAGNPKKKMCGAHLLFKCALFTYDSVLLYKEAKYREFFSPSNEVKHTSTQAPLLVCLLVWPVVRGPMYSYDEHCKAN